VLQKGCPLDLHPRAFGPGHAVATTLARVPLILWQVDQDSYLLLPRSSFADYVARWLLDASQELACDFEDGAGR
jgi:sarcosine oxidase subunit gamma